MGFITWVVRRLKSVTGKDADMTPVAESINKFIDSDTRCLEERDTLTGGAVKAGKLPQDMVQLATKPSLGG